ncbi:AzlC family ABC transporter permease [Halosimplex pelagicum]|uniref:AzlC family ABC transporter permease n=1 Tax=Halosimplex pelagicum TaxID=869886 RepID=A0A7D5TDF9_9EURY|nr:AzlC family ABC transporter permease [Halosimplex pelagicum]QLH83749.1 AzlC family ABC transporter permease [Halosimplex pelagicum]
MTGNDHPSEVDQSADRATDDPGASVDAAANEVVFDRAGIRDGFLTCVPIALGVAGYGIAFGVLADRAGLTVVEAALMSATVLAGASQIIAVELWSDPIPVATVVLAVFAVNLRYSLMGAALRPWFRYLSGTRAYLSLFFMADENWALTMREFTSGSQRGAFLLGSGLAIWVFWVASSVVGVAVGGVIDDPATFGLDFVLVATFVALAVELWDGSSTAVPWAVALVTALATSQLLSGQWHVIAGGLAAAVVEVARYE